MKFQLCYQLSTYADNCMLFVGLNCCRHYLENGKRTKPPCCK